MIAILVFILMLILLDLIAVRRGADSTDGINSREWERRQHWGEKFERADRGILED